MNYSCLITLYVLGAITVGLGVSVATHLSNRTGLKEIGGGKLTKEFERIAAEDGLAAVDIAKKAAILFIKVHEAIRVGKQLWIVDDGQLEQEITGILGEKIQVGLLDTVASLEDMPDISIRRGQVGTVVEILESNVALVEFSDDKTGVAIEVIPVNTGKLLKLHHGEAGHG